MRAALVLAFVLACGGSKPAAGPPIANNDTPPPASEPAPKVIRTRLPPNPTRQDIDRALDEIHVELAPAQQALADAATETDKQAAQDRVRRLVDEQNEIRRIRRDVLGEACDPRDPLCGE